MIKNPGLEGALLGAITTSFICGVFIAPFIPALGFSAIGFAALLALVLLVLHLREGQEDAG